MMDELPELLLITDILSKLEPKDLLSFAKTSKTNYQLVFTNFPHITSTFSIKYNVGKCFDKMLDFIKQGGIQQAKWCFTYKKLYLSLYRVDRRQFININGKSQGYKNFYIWLETHLFPNWDHIEFHTACWYKSKKKRQEYHNISIQMMSLLKHSLANPITKNSSDF
jgi:hypothetical protein